MDCILKCKFREELIVPYVALSPNIQPFCESSVYVNTHDGVRAKVERIETAHICTLENDVKRIYGIDMWSFIMRWYKFDHWMESMYFIKLKLKRI